MNTKGQESSLRATKSEILIIGALTRQKYIVTTKQAYQQFNTSNFVP